MTGLLLFVTLFLKLFCLVFLLFIFRPAWLLQIWNRIRVQQVGLSRHFLKITGDLEISYLERKGTSNEKMLIFLHGFTGDKEMFCDIVKLLPKTFHVIAIDLPGHGESKPNDENSDYTVGTQVEHLHKFIKAFGLNEGQAILIGESMGGHIAGIYAAKYGHMLSSVVMLCPAGINHPPETTDFIENSRKGSPGSNKTSAFLPKTVEEYFHMMKLVVHHDMKIPRKLVEGDLELRLRKMTTHQKVYDDLLDSYEEYFVLPLESFLEHITIPVLCIWGKQDQILHVSSSEVVKQKLQSAEVHIIEECGHSILLDQPREFLKILLEFLQKL